MGAKSKIGWTDATWSPLRVRVKEDAAQIAREKGYSSLVSIGRDMAGHVGPHCEKVSTECVRCYSCDNNSRGLPNNGTRLPFDRRSRDLVEPFVDMNILVQPLHWRTPKHIFPENQSDLFGEWIPDEHIDLAFAVMALCPQHTFQVLTKRPERMRDYLCAATPKSYTKGRLDLIFGRPARFLPTQFKYLPLNNVDLMPWPLPNVQLGVSAGTKKAADERIPVLLQIPAAKHFVSYEPALEEVKFRELPSVSGIGRYFDALSSAGVDPGQPIPYRLDWVIVGGESGPGARPFDIAWARQTVQDCKAAGVLVNVKQLGAKPWNSKGGKADHLFQPCGHECECCDECPSNKGQIDKELHPQIIKLKDKKGADWDEWPSALNDLKVREVL